MSTCTLVVGLGYGDEGKGSVVDYLCRKKLVHTVVRYNGGAQAAHNVVLADGRHHTFSQFGSGTFVPGVMTHLSRFMLVNPVTMLAEERRLRKMGVTDAFDRTTIDREAIMTTPFHMAMNRLRELARGAGAHGSCGMGIGETVSDAAEHPADALRIGDLQDHPTLRRKLQRCQDLQREKVKASIPPEVAASVYGAPIESRHMVDTLVDTLKTFAWLTRIVDGAHLRDALNGPGEFIFEGAQGVLLDEVYGFSPHTTWSKTTTENGVTLLVESSGIQWKRLGVIRSYATRHGAGPMVTEDEGLQRADVHNVMNEWAGCFRVGHFDLVATRYAINACLGIEELAVTHMDRRTRPTLLCTQYGQASDYSSRVQSPDFELRAPGKASDLAGVYPVYETLEGNDESFLRRLEAELGARVEIASYGPTAQDKVSR